MQGAEGTLYDGEQFQLQFKFGSSYPFESPEVNNLNINFNKSSLPFIKIAKYSYSSIYYIPLGHLHPTYNKPVNAMNLICLTILT